jgi:hypothetical protein
MREHTITDAEAQQLLSGATPEGRPELAELAASITVVRREASQLAAPQPSAALAARLERPALGVSVGAEPTPLKGIKKMAASLAGLSLAAKLAAATGVLALGLTGVGAAGALPGPAQEAFDGVVSTLIPTEDEVVDDGAAEECVVDDGTVDEGTVDDGTDEGTVDDELYGTTDDGTTDDGTTEDGTDEGTVTEECADDLPVGSGEFSDWVKQGAKDPNKVGSEFGAAVSEQARELKNEKAEERAANAGGNNGNGGGQGNGSDDDDADDDETSTGNGKPAGTPGGRP